MTKIAAYTDDGIWGMGDTDEDAIQNALQYMGPLSDTEREHVEGCFSTAPMTQRLSDRVEINGFNCKTDTFSTRDDGVLCTDEEEIMNVIIRANDNSVIYDGDIDDMPEYGAYVDIYEEAVNQGIDSGTTSQGWTWEIV